MHVTTAEQSATRDAAAIAAGTEGLALMLQAGTCAAAVIMRLAGARVAHGVDVLVGGGNNGGDGYIVAAQLARLGVNVRVVTVKPPATPDAKRAAALAKAWIPQIVHLDALLPHGKASDTDSAPARGVIIDALLGTGAHGDLRDHMRDACQRIHAARQRGAMVLSLDMPTGVHATTGEQVRGHVIADATIMFGTLKFGALSARHACGHITVVDIGLGVHASLHDDAAQLASAEALHAVLPTIAWNAHKGTRGRTLIVGGNAGMSGAVQLACSGALASGAGLVRSCVAPESIASLQTNSVAVVCSPWPEATLSKRTGREVAFDHALDEALHGGARGPLQRASFDHEHIGAPGTLQHEICSWAHVVAIGPGLGRDEKAATLLHHVLECVQHSDVAMVLDADALTVMAQNGMLPTLRSVASVRPVVITPHLGEFRTIATALDIAHSNGSAEDSLRATREIARALQCTVLCKGTPSICASAAGDAWVIPRGSNALATGGTGDVLTGVIAALLATAHANDAAHGGNSAASAHGSVSSGTSNSNNALNIARNIALSDAVNNALNTTALAVLGAWIHGLAGETLAPRGSTVADVVRALPAAWSALNTATPLSPGVLAELPSVHERAVR